MKKLTNAISQNLKVAQRSDYSLCTWMSRIEGYVRLHKDKFTYPEKPLTAQTHSPRSRLVHSRSAKWYVRQGKWFDRPR